MTIDIYAHILPEKYLAACLPLNDLDATLEEADRASGFDGHRKPFVRSASL
jgi:hypothetical protein